MKFNKKDFSETWNCMYDRLPNALELVAGELSCEQTKAMMRMKLKEAVDKTAIDWLEGELK